MNKFISFIFILGFAFSSIAFSKEPPRKCTVQLRQMFASFLTNKQPILAPATEKYILKKYGKSIVKLADGSKSEEKQLIHIVNQLEKSHVGSDRIEALLSVLESKMGACKTP